MRGRSLSWVMPVISALKRNMPPELLSMGATARVKRMIPMPPSQRIRLRQSSSAWPDSSRVGKEHPPVVVKSLMDSKKASVTVMCVPAKMNGSIPNSDSITQVRAVSRMASRRPISWLCGRRRTSPKPAAAVRANGMRKWKTEPSAHISSQMTGSSIMAASMSNSRPMMRSSMGRLTNLRLLAPAVASDGRTFPSCSLLIRTPARQSLVFL